MVSYLSFLHSYFLRNAHHGIPRHRSSKMISEVLSRAYKLVLGKVVAYVSSKCIESLRK